MDTLRDEACPVCGETDAWDGDKCKVCGFVAPPDKFQDPDVDMHKRLDLRNNNDLDGGDVPGLNADTNDLDGDGFDDNTGEPIGNEEMGSDDVQPMLTCPNCGFQVEGGEPTSVSTDEPQEMGAGANGPAEGDLCPNCGQAPLESDSQVMAQEGVDPDDPNSDPGADAPEDMDPDDPNADPNADLDEEDPDADPDQDSPFPPKNGDSDEDADGDGDPDQQDQDDVDDDDDSDPAKKPFPPKKK